MKTYIADFVDREDALTAIWDSLTKADSRRLWLVAGRPGIGKSYLLEECRARGRGNRVICIRIDLTDQRLRAVPALILHLAEQLGAERAQQTLLAAGAAAALARIEPPSHNPPVRDVVAATVGSVEAGGMVAVGKEITQISGQVVTYVTQTVRYDDPWVQQQLRLHLGRALHTDLTALASPDLLLFLVDGWGAGSMEAREWLCDQLFDWIAAGAVQPAVAAIAEAEQLPGFPFPAAVGQLTLQELTPADIEEYWVQRRSLPQAELTGAIRYSGGVPLILTLIADQIARQAGQPPR